MKCANHPGRNAVVHCLSCNKPLCQECSIDLGDENFKCMNCSMHLTLQQMSERRHEKTKSKQSKKLEEKARKKKMAYLRILIPVCLGIVIAIVELLLYHRVSTPEAEQFVPSRDPSALIFVINQAIRDYAADHNGTVPASLNDLRGKYLPPERVGESDLEVLTYVRKSHSSYELRANRLTDDPMPPFVFTEKGIETGGRF